MPLRDHPAVKGVVKFLFHTRFVQHYKKHADAKLAAYGLVWEDIMVETPQVKRAISRLSPEMQQARKQRMIRALDMDLKHTHLPKEKQTLNVHTRYMFEELRAVEAEDAERAALNMN